MGALPVLAPPNTYSDPYWTMAPTERSGAGRAVAVVQVPSEPFDALIGAMYTVDTGVPVALVAPPNAYRNPAVITAEFRWVAATAAENASAVGSAVVETHAPTVPFDATGAYDQASDRRHSTQELMEQAYEDAYHQFIEPVVGGSGEHLVQTATGRPGAPAGQTHGQGILNDADPQR